MKKRALVAATVFSFALGVASAKANVIIDGDFNNPSSVDPFTTYNASSNFNVWKITAGSVDLIGSYWQAPTLGGGSVDLDGNNPGVLSQSFSATAGKYALTFDLSGNPDGGNPLKTVLVTVGGASQTDYFTTGLNTHGNMGYVPETLVFVWTGGATTLTFTSLDSSTSPYGPVIGAVSISAVPELSTWAMMLIGFAGIGFAAYRRAKRIEPATA